MPHYKLSYFGIKGRAELSRWIFAVADVKYEDATIEFKDWMAKKPTIPFQKLPVLEVDNLLLNQSRVIASYLAKEFGLSGRTNFEDAQIHAIADTIEDMWTPGIVPIYSPFLSEEEKAKKAAEFESGQLKTYADMFEQYFTKNVPKNNYMFGNRLTWGDLAIAVAWDLLSVRYNINALLASRPNLKEHYDLVLSHPKIKAYLATRPKRP